MDATAPVRWTKKDLIGIRDLSRAEIEIILDTAPSFLPCRSGSAASKGAAPAERLVVNWFHERTRTPHLFELAAKRLSADTLSITASSSSTVKGETLHDTLANIEAMSTDIIVIRHAARARRISWRPIMPPSSTRATGGMNTRPRRTLDAFTMRSAAPPAQGPYPRPGRRQGGPHRRHRAQPRGPNNIHAATKLGANVTVCGPATLLPSGIERFGVTGTTDLRGGTTRTSFTLRIQTERQAKALFPSIREYVKLFRIDRESLRYAPEHAIVMHPGPINRDLELSTEVADGPRSVILQQVTNGVAVRMAVMHVLANSGGGRGA